MAGKFFDKLVNGLSKTRTNISSSFNNIFSAFNSIDDDFYEELEEMLKEMSLEEILKVWANIDTTAAAAKKGTITDEPEAGETKDKELEALKEMAVKYGKKLFKLGVEKLVDAAPAPINSML